jgi:hypothetical protein
MQHMQGHLEKLRVQISECELIRDLATNKAKRELFNKLAEHYKVLAAEVEQAIAELKSGHRVMVPEPQLPGTLYRAVAERGATHRADLHRV